MMVAAVPAAEANAKDVIAHSRFTSGFHLEIEIMVSPRDRDRGVACASIGMLWKDDKDSHSPCCDTLRSEKRGP
jgi:hypothetical protein